MVLIGGVTGVEVLPPPSTFSISDWGGGKRAGMPLAGAAAGRPNAMFSTSAPSFYPYGHSKLSMSWSLPSEPPLLTSRFFANLDAGDETLIVKKTPYSVLGSYICFSLNGFHVALDF